MHKNLKISLLVGGITIKSAIQAIIIPILTSLYSSMNFILLVTSIQFSLVFGSIYLYQVRKWGFKQIKKKKLIFLSGFFTASMAILMIYSANTNRTPIVIQAILAGIPVIPSVIFRKLFLNKIVIYNKWFIGFSILFITSSIIVSTIPLWFVNNFKYLEILWIFLYGLGIVSMSAYNVIQEKYMLETEDESFYNEVTILFYSRIVEFILLISVSWLEYFIGFTANPIVAFVKSAELFSQNASSSLLLEGFVAAYLLSYALGIKLNTISTNWNMLIPMISNPLVILFFTIFGSLNKGLHYPLWIVLTCISLSLIGMILWVRGEKNKVNYVPI